MKGQVAAKDRAAKEEKITKIKYTNKSFQGRNEKMNGRVKESTENRGMK